MSRNTCLTRVAAGLALLFLAFTAAAQSVAFINPGKSDEMYWVTASAGHAGRGREPRDELEVQFAERDHLRTIEIAREIARAARGEPPGLRVITNDNAVAGELLKMLDGAGVKTFFAYSSIPRDQRGDIGAPRARYKGWLGSLEPKAEDAGYLTARALIASGARCGQFRPDGKFHLVAIAGDRTTPSVDPPQPRHEPRRRGGRDVVLDQDVYAAWTREKAAEQAEWLFQRYPHARLVWAANDLMAFGAMQAWEKRGGKPGKDAWFSGVNTSTEAMDAIKSGRLTALAGGHFITGAWAVVMLYDYPHGRDFKDEGLELDRTMFTLFDAASAERFLARYGEASAASTSGATARRSTRS